MNSIDFSLQNMYVYFKQKINQFLQVNDHEKATFLQFNLINV